MNTIINSGWFTVIIGVIIGSAINHVFWLVQTKRQLKQQLRTERLKRIDEICDFCTILFEASKKLYGLIITGKTIDFFSNTEGFWSQVPFFRTRMTIVFYFSKCLSSFDDLQITTYEFVDLMQMNMAGKQLTKDMLDMAFSKIEENIRLFQKSIIKIYSKELCLD